LAAAAVNAVLVKQGSHQSVRSAPYTRNADLFSAQLLDGLDLRLGINPEHRPGKRREYDPRRRPTDNGQQAGSTGTGERHGAADQALNSRRASHDDQVHVQTFFLIE